MRNNFWMAIGLAAGLILGLAAAQTQSELLLGLMRAMRPVGTLFLNLLSMCVLPLVAGAVFSGVAGLGDLLLKTSERRPPALSGESPVIRPLTLNTADDTNIEKSVRSTLEFARTSITCADSSVAVPGK